MTTAQIIRADTAPHWSRLTAVFTAVAALHVGVGVALMMVKPVAIAPIVEPEPIAIRWVTPVEAPPEPITQPVPKPKSVPVVKPKPVKPKVVPVVKAQPKPQPKPVVQPKPKPVLSTTAPSESVQTVETVQTSVSVTPVAPAPVAPPVEPTPPPVTPSVTPPASSVPATPKTVQGVAYKHQPELIYPASARARGEQGRVLVRVLIDTSGHVQEAVILSSSGSRSLDRAALKIAQNAVFYPYRENGVAQPVYVPMPLEFTLDEE